MPDRQYDLASKKHISPKHCEDVKGIACSWCIQVLLASTQEQIKEAYQKALNISLIDKAKALENFLEEEEQDDRETKKSKRNLIRKGPLRMVRPSLNKIRPQQAAI